MSPPRQGLHSLVAGVAGRGLAVRSPPAPTGAGKTHTMLGVDAEPGIYLRTLTDLFRAIEEARDNMDYRVSMSYLEVSCPPPRASSAVWACSPRTPTGVRGTPAQGHSD